MKPEDFLELGGAFRRARDIMGGICVQKGYAEDVPIGDKKGHETDLNVRGVRREASYPDQRRVLQLSCEAV